MFQLSKIGPITIGHKSIGSIRRHPFGSANWGWGRVEPKIEFVSPIAQDLKRAESQLKDMKKEGEVIPREVIVTKLKPQSKRKTKRKPKKNNKNKKKRTKKVKRLTPKYFWKKV